MGCNNKTVIIYLQLHSLVPHHPHWKQWMGLRILVWEWIQSLRCSQRRSLCLWWEIPCGNKRNRFRWIYKCGVSLRSKRWGAHLSIDHVRDHHYLVSFCIWEFQRKFGGLYIKRQHDGVLDTSKEPETKVTWNSWQKLFCNMIHKIAIPVSPQDHLSGQFLVDKHCLYIEHCTSEPDRQTDRQNGSYEHSCVCWLFKISWKMQIHFYHMDLEVDGQPDMIGNVIFPHIYYVV